MEESFRKGIVTWNIIIAICGVSFFISCRSHVIREHNPKNDLVLEQDTLYRKYSQYFKEERDSICGKANWKSSHTCGIITMNSDYYYCLRHHNYDKYKKVMKDIMLMMDYNSTCYVGMLSWWRAVHDKEFFEMSLELLKEDYQPAVDGFNPYDPVYEYAYSQLILPNIKSIDGKPFLEYGREHRDYFPVWLHLENDMNMKFYNFIMPLWNSGKIELYGEEHFRKDK